MKRKTAPIAPAIVPRLLTVPQAAQYLGVGPWAIRTLHWEGTVRGIRIGRRLLFDKAALDSYVDRLLFEAKDIFSPTVKPRGAKTKCPIQR